MKHDLGGNLEAFVADTHINTENVVSFKYLENANDFEPNTADLWNLNAHIDLFVRLLAKFPRLEFLDLLGMQIYPGEESNLKGERIIVKSLAKTAQPLRGLKLYVDDSTGHLTESNPFSSIWLTTFGRSLKYLELWAKTQHIDLSNANLSNLTQLRLFGRYRFPATKYLLEKILISAVNLKKVLLAFGDHDKPSSAIHKLIESCAALEYLECITRGPPHSNFLANSANICSALTGIASGLDATRAFKRKSIFIRIRFYACDDRDEKSTALSNQIAPLVLQIIRTLGASDVENFMFIFDTTPTILTLVEQRLLESQQLHSKLQILRQEELLRSDVRTLIIRNVDCKICGYTERWMMSRRSKFGFINLHSEYPQWFDPF